MKRLTLYLLVLIAVAFVPVVHVGGQSAAQLNADLFKDFKFR